MRSAWAFALALWAGVAGGAAAEDVPALVDALLPKDDAPTAPKSFSVEDFQEAIQNRIGVEEKPGTVAVPSTVAPELDALPKVSLEIRFEYKSATVSGSSLTTVAELSRALNHPKLAAYKFLVAGHTDAVGSNAYNYELSRGRARSVRDLLAGLGVAEERLVAVGFGEEKLRDPGNPESGSNRRVEIVNLQEKAGQ